MKDKEKIRCKKERAPVNWSEIHRRILVAQAAVEHGWSPSPEERKQILKGRAKILARKPESKTGMEDCIEVVEFLVASERYGVESRYVREVYPLKDLTPLPCTPPFVLGIINVRGEIISVIDIKKFFDLPEKGLTDLNKAIIVRNDTMEMGILADLVLGVRTIPLRSLQSSLPTLTDLRAEYLKGVTNERLVVLDIEKVLIDKRIVVQEQVET